VHRHAALAVPLREHLLPGHVGLVDERETRRIGRHVVAVAARDAGRQGASENCVVAGVVGNASLMEYGVIGRTVNVAARVEGLARVHGVDVLVTDAVRAHLDGRFGEA
jgi:class 3 adenylate cyclase